MISSLKNVCIANGGRGCMSSPPLLSSREYYSPSLLMPVIIIFATECEYLLRRIDLPSLVK